MHDTNGVSSFLQQSCFVTEDWLSQGMGRLGSRTSRLRRTSQQLLSKNNHSEQRLLQHKEFALKLQPSYYIQAGQQATHQGHESGEVSIAKPNGK